MIRVVRSIGFDTLLVQVRGRGDAYYASRLEPRATPLDRGPTGFDPLGEVILRAHGAGLRVHAWLNVNLVASVHDLPRHPRHVVRRHPEWLMAPRGFAMSPGALDARQPGYAARLAAWTRANAPAVEGLFTSPVPREAAAYLAEVIGDLVARYPVDGVHLDYVRYPDESFDYSASALREFRAEVAPELSRDERARLDARAVRSPLVYSDMFPMRWDTFRRSRLTALVMRVRTEVKRHRPEALVSAAVVADLEGALTFVAFRDALGRALSALEPLVPSSAAAAPPAEGAAGALPPALAREAARRVREAAELGDVSGLAAICSELVATSEAFGPYQVKVAQLADDFDFDGVLKLAEELGG